MVGGGLLLLGGSVPLVGVGVAVVVADVVVVVVDSMEDWISFWGQVPEFLHGHLSPEFIANGYYCISSISHESEDLSLRGRYVNK